jgi:hypothetical protein
MLMSASIFPEDGSYLEKSAVISRAESAPTAEIVHAARRSLVPVYELIPALAVWG